MSVFEGTSPKSPAFAVFPNASGGSGLGITSSRPHDPTLDVPVQDEAMTRPSLDPSEAGPSSSINTSSAEINRSTTPTVPLTASILPATTSTLPEASGSSSFFSSFGRRGSMQVFRYGQEASTTSSSQRLPTLHDDDAGSSKKGLAGDAIEMTMLHGSVKGKGGSKEDQAINKWRLWVVEQPAASGSTTPIGSPGGLSFNNHALSPILTPRMSSGAAGTALGNHSSPAPSGFAQTLSDGLLSARLEQSEFSIYNTESTRALREVELAIDTDVHAAYRAEERRLSTQPRLSAGIENPFTDLAPRMGSKRVRPIVLELVQALGHYVDAVWCTSRPHESCPWIAQPAAPSSSHTSSPLPATPYPNPVMPVMAAMASGKWTSRALTAVQEGKKTGHVRDPPTRADVVFWQEEVKHALVDVDDTIGHSMRTSWPFMRALIKGNYGDAVPYNVVDERGNPGGIPRLLNDLEEALWGDSPPRPMDFAYELPVDFDPYAPPEYTDARGVFAAGDMPLSSADAMSTLRDFFGEPVSQVYPHASANSPGSQASPHLPHIPSDDPNEVTITVDPLTAPGPTPGAGTVRPPILRTDTDVTHTTNSSTGKESRGVMTPGLAEVLNMDGYRVAGRNMSLEEVGRRRHQEWLESRRAAGTPVAA